VSDFMPGIADLRMIRHRTERIAELEVKLNEEHRIRLLEADQHGEIQVMQLRKYDELQVELAEERARLRRAITLLLETHKHPGSVRAWKAAGKFLRNHPLDAAGKGDAE